MESNRARQNGKCPLPHTSYLWQLKLTLKNMKRNASLLLIFIFFHKIYHNNLQVLLFFQSYLLTLLFQHKRRKDSSKANKGEVVFTTVRFIHLSSFTLFSSLETRLLILQTAILTWALVLMTSQCLFSDMIFYSAITCRL